MTNSAFQGGVHENNLISALATQICKAKAEKGIHRTSALKGGVSDYPTGLV